jgi:ATP-dependent DNA helicase RecQ
MNTKELLFIDLEVDYDKKIRDLGIVLDDLSLHTSSLQEVYSLIENNSAQYIIGHNIIKFDKEFLLQSSLNPLLKDKIFVDTLPVSLLLFNEKTFHSLPKNYKDEDNFVNDPLKDALLCKKLFFDAVEKFKILPQLQRNILYSLLKENELFRGFFHAIKDTQTFEALSYPILKGSILSSFKPIIQNALFLEEVLKNHQVELAFILALKMPELEVNAQPPKVLYDYPKLPELQKELSFHYETTLQNLEKLSEEIFGFASFREFPRQNPTLEEGATLSQKEIVQAGLRDDSFLAILPTGGGKTFTFWLPAIIKAKSLKTLTVVISPLQALIKDHIESFHEQVANYQAVALSGYLSPSERIAAIEKVTNGDADILYLAPESLRSNTVFNLLKNRVIERFVIDEAHCLSTWGNDFRHDYFYIGEFLRELLEAKPFESHIPVSCFTATAKPKVIEDIVAYIESSLNVTMKKYIAIPKRDNLDYEALEVENEKEKYTNLLELLQKQEGSSLVYIPSSTKKCDEVAEQLALDTGKNVRSFHSRLESDTKMQILKEYIDDTIDIIVATTAFGMGVDKPNIKNVIHYEISDSLENYAQEAGRGARDPNIRASCPVLFSQKDLDKHFTSLTRSKINPDEINAIFRVLKNDERNPVTLTTREIAARAGWDTEDTSSDYDMKVKTALLELEREDYLIRTRNRVRYYADAIAKNALEMLQTAFQNGNYTDEDQIRLSRVLQTLLGEGKPHAVQLDELSEILGYPHETISYSILELKELKIISDAKDLSLKMNISASKRYENFKTIENELFHYLIQQQSKRVRMNELNEHLLQALDKDVIIETNNIPIIKVILKSWRGGTIQSFKFTRIERQRDIWSFEFINTKKLQETILYKQGVATNIMYYLHQKLQDKKSRKKELIEFSIQELLSKVQLPSKQAAVILDKTLLHLHELHIVELANGRFIYYGPMTIKKLEKMLIVNKRYTKVEYKKRLDPYYQRKMEAVHIVGEYCEQLLKDSRSAQEFMKDYFTLSYRMFINKYGQLKEKFKRPMTHYRYNKIFNELSDKQKEIIEDKESQAIMILAGPGSGKTKVLVHKIASLILQEDIKADQFLMLTYSRTAMMEFKTRLFQLIGQLAYDIDIFTFHGFALQLIGREVHENDNILQNAIAIAAKAIEEDRVTLPFKTVVVLDEYQDINSDGFALIEALSNVHENRKRFVAVGDDDQCILSDVNGADIHFISKFEEVFSLNDEDEKVYKQYELLTNYRSAKNIVAYANSFIQNLSQRYKHNELFSFSKESGSVEITLCSSSNFQHLAVYKAQQLHSQKTTLALLAYTNNEVADLHALLHEKDIPASYLLNQESFPLKMLIEFRYLEALLSDIQIDENSLWSAYEEVEKRYKDSKNMPLVYKLIKNFIDEHEILTQSLWYAYLDEISMEQLIATYNKTLVSTIHKAKGKEFDHVILLLHKQQMNDNFLRLCYVGITRAKKSLTIITDNSFFQKQNYPFVQYYQDNNHYPQANQKTFVTNLKDYYLSMQPEYQRQNFILIAGSSVSFEKRYNQTRYTLTINGFSIAQFSTKFQNKIENYEQQGYKIVKITIEYVVDWLDENNGEVYREIPLCKIVMKRVD